MELKFDPYTTVLIRVVRTWGRAYPPSHRGNGQPRLYIMALVSAGPCTHRVCDQVLWEDVKCFLIPGLSHRDQQHHQQTNDMTLQAV